MNEDYLKRKSILSQIAEKFGKMPTLDPRGRDGLGWYELHVDVVCDMLEAAFERGRSYETEKLAGG